MYLSITIVDVQQVKGEEDAIRFMYGYKHGPTNMILCFTTQWDGYVVRVEWLIQLGTYTTVSQEQLVEFKWKGKKYKLYNLKSYTTW